MSGGRTGGSGMEPRNGLKPWLGSALSVLSSAVTVTGVGLCCSVFYPLLRDLRAERTTGESGTEERVLGFWTILVLAVLVGCFCCVFSWTLTYLDSKRPGVMSPALRDGPGFNHSSGLAALSGVMAVLTVIWTLT
ncbi:ADP-ribosylation factor-like protein 6-interacting protein 6 [Austrofundulus limnaeus]|uniref:ADP-ribosylation factor-like protein 6-interacting protein 6 n=1 Tax=Austrofundulus limnaeus TaxID=52670 RepID=A0A2I4D696_AUSLI|nr:PREDICTED: ADP-ribosylation factor-like protein 6-interacting protein 6 [Austrofundulus limnaeus]